MVAMHTNSPPAIHSRPVAGNDTALSDSSISTPGSSAVFNQSRFGLQMMDAGADSSAKYRQFALDTLLSGKTRAIFYNIDTQLKIIIQTSPDSAKIISVSRPGPMPKSVINTTFLIDKNGFCPILNDGGYSIDESEIRNIGDRLLSIPRNLADLPSLDTLHKWLDLCQETDRIPQ
jgi:hypothetical protein